MKPCILYGWISLYVIMLLLHGCDVMWCDSIVSGRWAVKNWTLTLYTIMLLLLGTVLLYLIDWLKSLQIIGHKNIEHSYFDQCSYVLLLESSSSQMTRRKLDCPKCTEVNFVDWFWCTRIGLLTIIMMIIVGQSSWLLIVWSNRRIKFQLLNSCIPITQLLGVIKFK